MTETEIIRETRVALSRRDDVIIWRNNTGRLKDANGRWVSFGLAEGSADLVGLVRVTLAAKPLQSTKIPTELIFKFGRFFALEAKVAGREKAHDTTQQDRWRDVVRLLGGFYRVFTSADEAVAAVEACKRGED